MELKGRGAHATYICKIKAQFYSSSTSFKTPAVILDLDETVLDNSQYQVELFYKDESFNMESWSDWVLREEAELVPGSKDFIEFISSLNVDGIWLEGEHGPIDFKDIPNLSRSCDLYDVKI